MKLKAARANDDSWVLVIVTYQFTVYNKGKLKIHMSLVKNVTDIFRELIIHTLLEYLACFKFC